MLLGLVGATLTMVLGGIVAYVSVRTKWRGRRLIDAMAWLPWMMPGIVLGVGFLWGFALLPHADPDLRHDLGAAAGLYFAWHAARRCASCRAPMRSFRSISRSARACTARAGCRRMWRIVIALAWPSFAVGWVLVFFGIMRELSASVLLYSVGSEVLSVVLLKLWANGSAEQVSVIGLMMMVLVIVFRWVQLQVSSSEPDR